MSLKGKKILITAGPTWVAIDHVRVISNIATGETGIRLAEEARARGAKVTLILGPVGSIHLHRSITVQRFCYFNQLHSLIRAEMKRTKYDIVIHSAAVSDYKPRKAFDSKIKSNIKNFSLELESTVKIVDKIKRYDPRVFLVIFKLELGIPRNQMIARARTLMRESRADVAVVNTFSRWGAYKALVIDQNKTFFQVRFKEDLARNLFRFLTKI